MGGWTSVRPTVVPPVGREAILYIALAPSAIIEAGEFISFEDNVVQIADEIYGDVRERIEQYIDERELDPEAEQELRSIVEMMR